MAFLKFLNKEKEQQANLPPIMPPIDKIRSSMSEIPEVPDAHEGDAGYSDIVPQHVDDLDLPPPSEKMEDLGIPAPPKEEIKAAIETVQKTEIKPVQSSDIPDEIPDLEDELKIPEPAVDMSHPMPIMSAPEVRRVEHKHTEHAEGPLFVDVSHYVQIRDGLEEMKNDVKKSDDMCANLNVLRQKEDSAFNSWHLALEEMERKMVYVDRVLFENYEQILR